MFGKVKRKKKRMSLMKKRIYRDRTVKWKWFHPEAREDEVQEVEAATVCFPPPLPLSAPPVAPEEASAPLSAAAGITDKIPVKHSLEKTEGSRGWSRSDGTMTNHVEDGNQNHVAGGMPDPNPDPNSNPNSNPNPNPNPNPSPNPNPNPNPTPKHPQEAQARY